MSMTNAQAALQAAATIHTGSKGNVSLDTVQALAHHFKRWLDRKDQADPAPVPTPPRQLRYSLPSSAGHPDNVESPTYSRP